ncbi:MAG: methionine--tRNA ligase, partial [Chitinophagia bacterium]|nr:methionine--tRNA ligase [Chitinophagia bacterium]
MTQTTKMMVTSALPYGNGPLHLGHMVEHIMTDIWVRSQRLLGHECVSLCGDDAHGTPIMLKAQQLGISPEVLTKNIQDSHEQDLKNFAVHYDVYHTTNSPENKAIVEEIYAKLQENGDIITETISQAYDAKAEMFLPDRYIKGTCPRCHALEQYGDNCEKCGATYSTTELIDAVSTVTGSKPEYRETLHYFFNLPRYQEFLQKWTQNGHIPVEMAHKLKEWFDVGLKPWDISRDAPYFGFQIPGTEKKYFYVWLDAPIGYMAACKKLCQEQNLDFNDFWKPDSKVELYHNVGKDIMYFHCLFWPALLSSAQYRLPNAIFTHGFLTVNGQKMSKSRGTFVQAQQFAKHLPTDTLRYYFAAKMNGGLEDLDLAGEDYIQRVNADLIGKVINIASRSASFIHKYFDGQLALELENNALFQQWTSESKDIILAYQQRDNAKAIRTIMALADKINQYVDIQKPWVMAKDE